MFQSHLPMMFQGECVLTATYLINKIPTKVLNGKTPYELLHGKTPVYGHLRTFYCLCFLSSPKHGRDKFQPSAKACVFIGYQFDKKAYGVMDFDNLRFCESIDVVFDEDIFPFEHEDSTPSQFFHST